MTNIEGGKYSKYWKVSNSKEPKCVTLNDMEKYVKCLSLFMK